MRSSRTSTCSEVHQETQTHCTRWGAPRGAQRAQARQGAACRQARQVAPHVVRVDAQQVAQPCAEALQLSPWTAGSFWPQSHRKVCGLVQDCKLRKALYVYRFADGVCVETPA